MSRNYSVLLFNPVSKYFLSAVILAILTFGVMVFPAHTTTLREKLPPAVNKRYAIEVSISRRILILYEKKGADNRVLLKEYKVGTAVQGLNIYPLGLGKVTDISFNPWWYPTPYSRQVFRKRGISLPSSVPPGHPLNYMGLVKISLSHRTRKGAIYRIHGNNDPGRVGRRVTGGCIVMFNKDGLELARTISVGTEVNIIP